MTCPPTVCQLAPCQTDDCPLTGRCTRQWPWRRTAAAIFDRVNPQHDATMYEEVPGRKARSSRLTPYDCEASDPLA